jgi:potassium efflux system protein
VPGKPFNIWSIIVIGWRCSSDLIQDFKGQPWLYLLVAAGVIGLLLYQSRFRRHLIALNEQVNRRGNVSFEPTFRALLLTLLVAAPFPLLLVYLGMRFASSGE